MIAKIAAHTPQPAHPKSGNSEQIVLRQGTKIDLEAMLDIGLAAMPLDPQWNYRFPLRRAFPKDHRDATRQRYRDFLDNLDGRWSVVFADIINPVGSRSIAFAVWDIGNLRLPTAQRQQTSAATPSPEGMRRDGHQGRMLAWKQTLKTAQMQYFSEQFGSEQIQLQLLATHPDFQRLGAGSMLVHEGIRLARSSKKSISVFASPMGERLYSSLGFKKLGTVRVQVEGEQRSVSVEAMAYDLRSHQRYLSRLVPEPQEHCLLRAFERSIRKSEGHNTRACATSVHFAVTPKWKSAMA